MANNLKLKIKKAKMVRKADDKREQCQTCLSMAEREQSQDRDSGINYTN